MKLYKLTDQDGYTQKGKRGETKWEEGFTLSLPAVHNPELCTSKVIHAYKHLNLGLLLSPSHVNISDPIIWECEGEICIEDWEKVGVFSLTTILQVKTPDWFLDLEKRKIVQVRFAVMCVETVLWIYENENNFTDDRRPRNAIEMAKKYLTDKNDKNIDTATIDACVAAEHVALDEKSYAAARVAKAAKYAALAAEYSAYAVEYSEYKYDIDFAELADKAAL